MESLQPPPPRSQLPSSSVTSSSNSSAVIDSGERNWLDLPRDAVLSIFVKLDTIDLLVRAHNVCTTWRNISKDPILYRTINMSNLGKVENYSALEILCHRAIDYCCGHATDINVEYFGNDALLSHLANSASHLRSLRLAVCHNITDEGLCKVAEKLSHLEELDITISDLSHDSLKVIGLHCPRLKTFKFNTVSPDDEYEDDAFAIAQFMHGLCHLQLIGNKMTNDGLLAILDGCPQLESLDIRRCINIYLEGSLGKRCKEQIKYLRLPNDAIDDYPFDTEYYDPFPDEYDLVSESESEFPYDVYYDYYSL